MNTSYREEFVMEILAICNYFSSACISSNISDILNVEGILNIKVPLNDLLSDEPANFYSMYLINFLFDFAKRFFY
jgi:hypothetical protein